MKSFGAILMVLAAGASLVAALPAPGATTHGLETRAPMFYAQHLEARKKKDHHKGNATLAAAANNGTADGNNNDNGKGKGKDGANAGDNILETILGLLSGAAGNAGDAAGGNAAAADPLAILQGLLNKGQ
ncbi:hypothetical protein GGS24DRAFT_454152 [Hypoxylon argillaceum]|nr:hypothetical protein GGS24DRAFT_454152 [Hypoxylon argillaceum]KAI1153761.1 hypothetical protein F4825DRAFT_239692 [Nemania diffusa]